MRIRTKTMTEGSPRKHILLPMIVACGALGMRVLVTYMFRYSDWFGHTIVWWNGIFGFGTGFLITWSFYLSGRCMRSREE